MEIGKVPNDVLKEIVLNKIKHNRNEVLVRPKIGEDCCAVDFGEYACVLTSDPITGAANDIGRLAVHISCNDVASSGVEPLGLLTTILAPAGTLKEDLELVMNQLIETANSLNVEIIGGHTEITSAVNRFVIITTAVGKVLKEKLVTTSGANAGDDLIMTKSAGIEGTAIIAADKEKELSGILDSSWLKKAKEFVKKISVVKEGIIAGEYGVSAMHDITEGGVLGAVWEMAEASDRGIIINEELIPVEPETSKICEYYKINPLKLISSGCMLIACKNGEGLVQHLLENGVKASLIGRFTEDNKKQIVLKNGGMEEIQPPESDDLYKVVG